MLPIRDRNPRGGPAYVTWGLLAANVAVFLVQLSLDGRWEQLAFLDRWAFVPRQFFAEPGGEAATLVSSAFLHGGWAHLVGNLFFLGVFGDNVEDRLGHLRYLAFYLAAAVIATLAHGIVVRDAMTPLVGASGAISAVLGAYILMFPRRDVLALIPPLILPWVVMSLLMRVPRFYALWLPAWLYIGYWAFVQVLEAGNALLVGGAAAGGGVAWWAHVGGFAFGVLIARRRG